MDGFRVLIYVYTLVREIGDLRGGNDERPSGGRGGKSVKMRK